LKDGDKYFDACVRTRGKYEHAHGYYVARMNLAGFAGTSWSRLSGSADAIRSRHGVGGS